MIAGEGYACWKGDRHHLLSMARILDSDGNNMAQYSGTTENRSKHNMFSSFPDWEWKYLHENKKVYTGKKMRRLKLKVVQKQDHKRENKKWIELAQNHQRDFENKLVEVGSNNISHLSLVCNYYKLFILYIIIFLQQGSWNAI